MDWKLGRVMQCAATAAGSVLLLTGCLSFGTLDADLSNLIGKPVQEGFDILGYPDQQQAFGSDTVYTWARTRGADTPLCYVKLVADDRGIVRKRELEGTDQGCEPYMRAFYNHKKPQ